MEWRMRRQTHNFPLKQIRKFIYIMYKDGLLLPSLILEIIRLQHTTW